MLADNLMQLIFSCLWNQYGTVGIDYSGPTIGGTIRLFSLSFSFRRMCLFFCILGLKSRLRFGLEKHVAQRNNIFGKYVICEADLAKNNTR